MITLGSRVAADLETELRDSLLSALADGAKEIVLDLQGVDVITSSSRGLLEAVGAAVADRGGVLLVLTGGRADGEPCVMREVRGAVGALPDGGDAVAGRIAGLQ